MKRATGSGTGQSIVPVFSSIQIQLEPDPLSGSTVEGTREPVLIESAASRLLIQEMRRYCQGQVTGRSFLISGHRGSGKTTLVQGVCLRLMREHQVDDAAALRPLLVPLHGPNLLPEEAYPPPPQPAETAPPEGEDEREQQSKPKDNGQASDLQVALIQITLALYNALAREVSRGFRVSLLQREPSPERLEMAAQLALELDGYPDVARLREFWHRSGVLRQGVLFEYPRSPDQGLLEVLALASANRLYQRVSGSFSSSQKQKEEAKAAQSAEVGMDSKEKDLFSPLASLLTGGLVGTGVLAQSGEGIVATLSGLVAALGAAAVFKYSASRSRASSVVRESSFEADLTLATLDRELPKLIQRLNDCGLAPIFVVDELDKITGLSTRITEMVKRLKKFVAEQACFCFLTDRGYFETIRRKSLEEAYPIEYTYFTHQVFVTFGSTDLHTYLSRILRVPEPDAEESEEPLRMDAGEDEDASAVTSRRSLELMQRRAADEDLSDFPILPWVLLHRARMHAIDLRRLLTSLRTEEGTLALRPGLIRTAPGFRYDLMTQLAIERILDRSEMRGIMEREAEFRRLAHDALYYPTRMSTKGSADEELDLTDHNIQQFCDYLVERMLLEKPTEPSPPVPASAAEPAPEVADCPLRATDLRFLYKQVRDLARFLAYPEEFKEELRSWRPDLPPPIWDALPERGSLAPLAEKVEHRYRWLVDHTGRDLGAGVSAETAAAEDWQARVEVIRELDGFLRSHSEGLVDFTTLSSQLHILPTSPAWPSVAEAAERLSQHGPEDEPYPEFEDDQATVLSFWKLLQRGSRSIAFALAAGALVGRVSQEEGIGARTLIGLDSISHLHDLESIPEQQRREEILEEVWRSLSSDNQDLAMVDPAELDPDGGPESWQEWAGKMAVAVESDSLRTDRKEVQRQAWEVWRERLSRRIESGKRTFPPVAEDLLSRAAGYRPGNLLLPDCTRMTIAAWTKAMIWGLADVTPQHRHYCPRWMAAWAAVELGWLELVWHQSVFLPDFKRYTKRTRGENEGEEIPEQVAEWLEEESRHAASRTRILMIRSARGSIISEWLPSPKCAAMSFSPKLFKEGQALVPITREDLEPPWLAIELPIDSEIVDALPPQRSIVIARREPKDPPPGPLLIRPGSVDEVASFIRTIEEKTVKSAPA